MDRALPHNIDNERATLGAILLDREAIVAVDGWLLPEHFYLEKHAWIYAAALACYRSRIPPDTSTVSDELRRHDRLEQVGGLLYLIDLANSVPTAVHIEYYAKSVKDTGTLRRLILIGGKIAALGYDERDDVTATLAKVEGLVQEVAQQTTQNDFYSLEQIAWTVDSQITAAANGDGRIGIPTGYIDLDEVTNGLHGGDLIILAARPAVGKSSMAMCLARNLASAGERGAVFSLEMGREQLAIRLLAMMTGIDTQRIQSGNIHDQDLARTMEAIGQLGTLPIHICDDGALTIADIRSRTRRLHAAVGIKWLVIDYLQLLSGSSQRRDGNRVQEVSEISRSLKQLARELDVPIIALSQLSRAVEGRASHVPMLSDLRESGSLEQDADAVWFLYREELYDKETDKKGIAELHIAKHRNGPTAVIPLRFDANTTQFQSLERYRSPEGY